MTFSRFSCIVFFTLRMTTYNKLQMLLLPECDLNVHVITSTNRKGLRDISHVARALNSPLFCPFPSQPTVAIHSHLSSCIRLSHDFNCINYVWTSYTMKRNDIKYKMHLSHRNHKEPTYMYLVYIRYDSTRVSLSLSRNPNITTNIFLCWLFLCVLFNFCFHSVVCPNKFVCLRHNTHSQHTFVSVSYSFLSCICMQTENNDRGRQSNWI